MVVNIFLFDDFEVMDAFGLAQIFGGALEKFYIRYIERRQKFSSYRGRKRKEIAESCGFGGRLPVMIMMKTGNRLSLGSGK